MTFDKKHVWRRLLIFALCFSIMFTLYSDMSAVFALAPDQSEAAWQNTQGGELYYGSFSEAIGNVGAGGTVILRSDVSLTAGITISKPMTITSWSADEPHIIKNTEANDSDDRKDTGRIFTVSNGQLLLQNIILDGGKDDGIAAFHPLICITGGTVRMLNGAMLRNAENKSPTMCGGAVNIRSGALYMYDGSKIMNCKSRHGGGVEVNSSNKQINGAMFGMAGGSIENCTADCGGGVYVNIGMFQMQGGKIIRNKATDAGYGKGGGGIYVAGERYTAAVRIAGGEISGNTAVSTGGGVLVNGGFTLLQIEGGMLKSNYANTGGGVSMIWGSMKLFGGTITENTAELYGGGVLGSPDSRIYLQGAPQVFANTAKDKEDSFDNVYLDGNRESDKTSPIQITGSLGNGIRLGLTRWVRPDDTDHAFKDMIVSDGKYTITQNDLDKLSYNREQKTGLYADNMQDFGFIPKDGKIVMVLAVDVELDKEILSFEGASGQPRSVTATVTPANAPEKGVTWSSTDENVATVDENGNVTPVGKGMATITATTVAPYHAAASCTVTVGCYKLTTEAAHGTITYTPDNPHGYFSDGDTVTLEAEPDEGYKLSSLKAYKKGSNEEIVIDEGNKVMMPDCDITVKAKFEPIPKDDDSAPASSGGGAPTSSGGGAPTLSESKPACGGNIPSGAPADSEPSSDDTPSESDEGAPASSGSTPADSEPPSEVASSADSENTSVPIESTPTNVDANPLTGRAVSFIPFSVIMVAVTVAAARKNGNNCK